MIMHVPPHLLPISHSVVLYSERTLEALVVSAYHTVSFRGSYVHFCCSTTRSSKHVCLSAGLLHGLCVRHTNSEPSQKR